MERQEYSFSSQIGMSVFFPGHFDCSDLDLLVPPAATAVFRLTNPVYLTTFEILATLTMSLHPRRRFRLDTIYNSYSMNAPSEDLPANIIMILTPLASLTTNQPCNDSPLCMECTSCVRSLHESANLCYVVPCSSSTSDFACTISSIVITCNSTLYHPLALIHYYSNSLDWSPLSCSNTQYSNTFLLKSTLFLNLGLALIL